MTEKHLEIQQTCCIAKEKRVNIMNVHNYKTLGGKDVTYTYLDQLPSKESALGYDIITA